MKKLNKKKKVETIEEKEIIIYKRWRGTSTTEALLLIAIELQKERDGLDEKRDCRSQD